MAISNSSQGARPGICTSTSRPTNPYEGFLIYETDTDLVYLWNGSAWVEVVSALTKAPRGILAYVVRTAGNYTATTSFGDVTGLSVTFNAVANRYYKINFGCQTRKLGGTNYIEFVVTDSSNTVLYDSFSTIADNDYHEFHFSYVSTFSAGSQTLKIRSSTGGGTATIYGSATNPSWLLVEDIGAV